MTENRKNQESESFFPGQPSQADLNALIKLYMSGQAAAVEILVKQYLKKYPGAAVLHMLLGAALSDQSRFSDAVVSYQQALALDPNYAEAHTNLGATYRSQGLMNEARACHERAIALNPNFAAAHYNLGIALDELGMTREAIKANRRAIELQPSMPSAYFNLHTLLIDAKNMTPAIESLKKAIEFAPNNTKYKTDMIISMEYSGIPASEIPYIQEIEAKGTPLDLARLDAWNYMKQASPELPPMFGTSIQGFRMGIEAAKLEGLVLEFGVRHGTSIRMIAEMAKQDVHGFDSFEGLPEAWHHEPKGSYTTEGRMPTVPDNVTLYKGWFEDTLPEFVKTHKAPVRFMNVDCDIYSGTVTILKELSAQIVPGTVIVFDEYIGNRNWRLDEFKALQEAVKTYGWKYEYLGFSLASKQAVIRIL